jgi:hypothetical protein
MKEGKRRRVKGRVEMRKVKRGREECKAWKWARCAELRTHTIKNLTKA